MNYLNSKSVFAAESLISFGPTKEPILPLEIRRLQAEFAEIANRKLGVYGKCEFGLVKTSADWNEVRRLRLKIYGGKREYLSSLVNRDGLDEYDNHSYLFYAKLNEKCVASVRLTEYPFETSSYLSPEDLRTFLGKDYERNYLEVGRLVTDSEVRIPNLSHAVLAFSMRMASLITSKSRYLAYANPRLKSRAFRYSQEAHTQSFFIPERRKSEYVLFKGSITQELDALRALAN